MATVDGGTALAPLYMAHDSGLRVHRWVYETRPRNQGASLAAWELGQHGIPHTVIAGPGQPYERVEGYSRRPGHAGREHVGG